ncbi:hypothetical protein PVAND_014895 [Polypedilum vanderplanki]|uniref:Tetratricopeptide repeat protein n=1 Tax=Polypedilum vanderplanki TaxID=319348 RepID=A0A9J6BBE7_POLVA|nr:hypothetical protein PVAND_014895 [Polypedilum vanderplanki]
MEVIRDWYPKNSHVHHFDTNSGEFLSNNQNEAKGKAKQKGINELKNENFEKAETYFEFSGDQHLKIIAEKLKDITEDINNNQYDQINTNLKEAQNLVKENEVKSLIENKMNKLAEIYVGKGKENFINKNWSEAKQFYELAKEISINNSKYEDFLTIVSKMMNLKKENEIETLNEILNLINDLEIKNFINNELKNAKTTKAQDLSNEGQKLFNESKFDEALKKFEAVKEIYGTDQGFKTEIQNAQDKIDEIGAMIRQQNEEKEAKDFFDKAMKDFIEAIDAEDKEKLEEAESKFNLAKENFKKAKELNSSNKKYQNWFIIISLKIDGNDLYNEGIRLFNKAIKLKDLKKYKDAKVKFELARQKFEEAKKLSKEIYFDAGIEVINKEIEEVENEIQLYGEDEFIDQDLTDKTNTPLSGNSELIDVDKTRDQVNT